MIRAEYFFNTGNILSEQRLESAEKPIPFNWYSHPAIQPIMDLQSPMVIDEVPNCLKFQAIPALVPKLLSQSEILDETLTVLSPQNQRVDPDKVSGMLLQMGKKAYIIICKAETPTSQIPFALYISRLPKDSALGDEAERDFTNLQGLSKAAEARLTDYAKQKYRFMHPIALGVSPSVDGHQYTWFTMPFVEDYGELRAMVLEDLSLELRFTYFGYAFHYNQVMREYNKHAENNAKTLRNEYIRLTRKFGRARSLSILDSLPERVMIRKQLEDLLIGNALIYLLSDGYFPKDFFINSGDWMVHFSSKDRLNLYLITIRGGWEYLGNDQNWITRMEDHCEQVPGKEFDRVNAIPIFWGEEDLIPRSLERARKLVR